MLLFLSHYEENGVQHIDYFGNEVKVRGYGDAFLSICVFVVYSFAAQAKVSLTECPVEGLSFS